MKHTMSAKGAHAHFTIEDWRQVMDRNVATTSRRCDDKLAGTELGLPPPESCGKLPDIAYRGQRGCTAITVDGSQAGPYNQRRLKPPFFACQHCLLAPVGVASQLICTPPTLPVRFMVLLEMSITPLGKGESVSQYVAECVRLVDASGLDYELHSMGTIVEGELDEVLDLMHRCIELVATHSDRVTCAAKLDYRRGQGGRIRAKVESVRQKLPDIQVNT